MLIDTSLKYSILHGDVKHFFEKSDKLCIYESVMIGIRYNIRWLIALWASG